LSSFGTDVDISKRGFTDHEHLDEQELIHMNGRVYDYNLGRFLSVDPFIQFVGNSQGINPYSYIMNNPLAGTDPTGYVIETVWDVANVIYDAGKVGYGLFSGNDNMVSEGLTDMALDAAAVMIPFVPAGASKVARAGADKVADVRKASKKSDTAPTTQKTDSASKTDSGSKGNGSESSQSASGSKPESTADINGQSEISKQSGVHGNSTKSDKPTQHYKIEDQNGKPYDGVGGVDGKRANASQKNLEKKNPDKQFTIKEQTNHSNRSEAYKAEDRGIQSSGGPGGKDPDGANYNKINSPGKKLNDI
jgi:RHS repeat-associated protein